MQYHFFVINNENQGGKSGCGRGEGRGVVKAERSDLIQFAFALISRGR